MPPAPPALKGKWLAFSFGTSEPTLKLPRPHRTTAHPMTEKMTRVNALLARAIEWPCDASVVRMIALEEDCRLAAYQDDGGIWTCGWGETDGVQPGARWTQEYADERLRRALQEWVEGVQRALAGAYANTNQLAAMLCLAYNIGMSAFARSTVCRLHRAGDYSGAARAFALWNMVRDRSTGKLRPHPALEARRAREAARYLEPVPDQAVAAPMPQAVQAESKLAASPIAQAGVVTAGIGSASALVEAARSASAPADSVLNGAVSVAVRAAELAASAGITPQIVVPLVLVATGVCAVYWRWKQRRGGWA